MTPQHHNTLSDKDELIHTCLLLAQLPKVGSQRIIKLVERFGSLDGIKQVDPKAIASVANIGSALAYDILTSLKSPQQIEKFSSQAMGQMEKATRLNASIVTYWDEAYPELLKEIYDSPAILFVRGTCSVLKRPMIAVVGTRHNSDYGKHITENLCKALSESGLLVVSGLAYGIDTIAHKTAVELNYPTVAVLAGGIDYIYTDPKGKLYPKIIEQGALVSEELIGTKATSDKFPKRNRIISGLALGTLIVESDVNGGALITASYALDQNREVFAVPGSVFSKKSRGTNLLIQEGKAKLVLGAEDMLCELSRDVAPKTDENKQNDLPLFTLPDSLSSHEKAILEHFHNEAIHIDELAIKTGLDISELLGLLFELELKGLIEQLPGKNFQRKLH